MKYTFENIDEINKQVTAYCIKNRSLVTDWDRMNDEDREHLYNIASSIVTTRERVMMGGGFVTAVVENNLEGAVGRADSVCIKALPLFVNVKLYFHLND